MLNLLGINIRQFDEGEEDFSQYIVDGSLDVDKIVEDYSQEQTDTIEESEEMPDSDSEEENTEVENEEQEQEQEQESDNEADEQDQNTEVQDQKKTADQAFAEMRRQLEANEPLAKWVHDLAAQQGFSDPKELIDAYEEQRLAKEAEQKGVPVDVYKRLYDLERENKEAKEKAKSQQFNYEVEATKNKYNLDDEQIEEVFKYMGQNGYDAGQLPFEDLYVLANRDKIIQEAEERGRQQYLEEKQKQQQQATPNVGTNANDKNTNDLDYSKEGIFNTFKEMGIEID